MNLEKLEKLLAAIAAGEVSPAAAAEELARLPFADLPGARLDTHRELRTGVPEIVLAAGKTDEELEAICRRLVESQGGALVTRLAPGPAAALAAALPDAVYHARARLLTCGEPVPPGAGGALVVAAGTSDLPIAEEAALSLEWLGHPIGRRYDVGVAGLHRLLAHLEELRAARVLIVVAGMDGVLPTVVAGLVPAPVIAVPTSTGYGAGEKGLAALLAMLNSCAPGVAVVNIDNGFGAAAVASKILKRFA